MPRGYGPMLLPVSIGPSDIRQQAPLMGRGWLGRGEEFE